MKQRLSHIPNRIPVASVWRRLMAVLLLSVACAHVAFAQSTGSLDSFISPLKNGLNLIMVFGFIAGCVMVMSGFLNAKRDENWKMTVIYGIGVAGAVALMKALFAMFGGAANSAVTGF
jgi:hypothetical protein